MVAKTVKKEKVPKTSVKDKYHALKQKGTRHINRLHKEAVKAGGDIAVHFVLHHVKGVAAKKLAEVVEKGEKFIKGKLHQGIEKTGKYVTEKIGEKVKDKDIAKALKTGTKTVKQLAHKSLETGAKKVKEYALKEIEKGLKPK